MRTITPVQIQRFRRKVLRFYKYHGRNLPWRNTTDPYCIAVSELMLQQTQVARVQPKYETLIERWPDWKSLAKATPRELLAAWSGLGYNRRAMYLGRIARTIVEEYNGAMPDVEAELRKLSGIGPYTARAILIFAFNRPLAAVDTNIRRVLLQEFGLPDSTSSRHLEALAGLVLPKRRSRDWHNALMDYSQLALPAIIPYIRPVSRQSPFEGSIRQIRGEIVRQLTRKKSVRVATVARAMGRSRSDVLKAARSMAREGIVALAKVSIVWPRSPG